MTAAAEAIAIYTSRGRQTFEGDSTVRDAVLYQIISTALLDVPKLRAELEKAIERLGED